MSTTRKAISSAITSLKTRLIEKETELESLDRRYEMLRARLESERDAISEKLVDLEATRQETRAPVPGGPARSSHSSIPLPPTL